MEVGRKRGARLDGEDDLKQVCRCIAMSHSFHQRLHTGGWTAGDTINAASTNQSLGDIAHLC